MASGWDAYIANLMASSSYIQRAAIVGLNDGSLWAKSTGEQEFKGTEAELTAFAAQFANTMAVPAVGTDLEGIHYVVPRAEESLLFGKKEKNGFVAAKSDTAIIVALFTGENAAGAGAREAVERLSKYLIEIGY